MLCNGMKTVVVGVFGDEGLFRVYPFRDLLADH
mgnify:CR=1 FL=1